jgi:4-hydroxybutyrate dehydrogenase
MQALKIVPKIHLFDTFKEFADEFKIGKNDLVLTHEFLYEPFMKPLGIETNLIFQEKYGMGEPSDEMIDAITAEMRKFNFDRIIAFGGGTIIDIAKLFALDMPDKSIELFEGAVAPVKIKELVLVPTTCGTGSEVTNISIAELKSKHIKKGLAVDQLYAEHAVLIPETIKGLPYKFFCTSSVDALIHAIEAFVSPKATPYTELFSLKAIEMIVSAYKQMAEKGENERFNLLKEFAIASNYAGIAFGNAGVGPVHALAYSIGGAFHVAHGEANYQFFTEVMKMYFRKKPVGKIQEINLVLAKALGIDPTSDIYAALEDLLGKIITKKPLREYGMKEDQIVEFTDSTIANQQRILGNTYVPLSREDFIEIFTNLY